MTATLTATATTSSSTASYDLENGAYSGMPSLVGTALGPARSWFSGALEWVCGEPDTLTATGRRYAELGQQLRELSGSLATAVDGLPSWQGPAATRFRTTTKESVDVLDAVGGFVGHTDQILRAAAEVAVKAADAVWDLVTELVTWLCTTLVKALAASTVSMGSSIAAWLSSAVAQVGRVVGVVAQLCGKVGAILTRIMGLLQKLAALITRYKDLLAGIQRVLTTVKEFSARFGEVSDGVPGHGPTWQAYRDADPSTRAGLLAPAPTDPSGSPLAGTSGPGWTPGTGTQGAGHPGLQGLGSAGLTGTQGPGFTGTQTPGFTGTPTPGFTGTQTPGLTGTPDVGSAGLPPSGTGPVGPQLPETPTPSTGAGSGRFPLDRSTGGVADPQPYRPTVDGTRVAGIDPVTPAGGPANYRPDLSGATAPSGGAGWTPPPGGAASTGWTAPSGGGFGSAGVPRPGSIDAGTAGIPGGSASVAGPGPRIGSSGPGIDPALTPLMPMSPQQRASSGSGVPLDQRDEAWSETATDREAELAMGTRAAGASVPVGGVGGVGSVGPMSGTVTGLPQAPAGPSGPAAAPGVDPLPRVTGAPTLPATGTGSNAAIAAPPLNPGRRDDRAAAGAGKPVSDRTTDLIDLVDGDRTEELRHG